MNIIQRNVAKHEIRHIQTRLVDICDAAIGIMGDAMCDLIDMINDPKIKPLINDVIAAAKDMQAPLGVIMETLGNRIKEHSDVRTKIIDEHVAEIAKALNIITR